MTSTSLVQAVLVSRPRADNDFLSRGGSYPNAHLCATSKLCQYSSGSKNVRRRRESASRTANDHKATCSTETSDRGCCIYPNKTRWGREMRQVSRVRSYRFSLRGRRPVSVSFHAYAKKPRDGMHNGIVMRVASKRGLPHNKPTRPRPCQRSIRLFSSTNESWIPPKETLPDKIPHGPGGYWTQRENRVTFFNWLFHRLNLKSMDDWYSVTRNEVYRYGGTSSVSSVKR
jgi:hypothetical protein